MNKKDDKIIETPKLSIIGSEYINKWVVLSPDYKKLLAVGKTLRMVLKNTKNIANKTIIKVLPNLGYVPAVC